MPEKKVRKLTKEKKEELIDFFKKSTFTVPESYFEGKTYKEILAEEKRKEYESLG